MSDYCSVAYTGPLCAICNPQGYYYSPGENACVLCPKQNGSRQLLLAASFLLLMFVFFFGIVTLILLCFCSSVKGREKIKAKVMKYRERIIQSIREFGLIDANDEVLNRLIRTDKQSRDGSYSLTEITFDTIKEKTDITRTRHHFGYVEIRQTVTSKKLAHEKMKTVETHFESSSAQSQIVALISQVQNAREMIKSIISFLQISVNVSLIAKIDMKA